MHWSVQSISITSARLFRLPEHLCNNNIGIASFKKIWKRTLWFSHGFYSLHACGDGCKLPEVAYGHGHGGSPFDGHQYGRAGCSRSGGHCDSSCILMVHSGYMINLIRGLSFFKSYLLEIYQAFLWQSLFACAMIFLPNRIKLQSYFFHRAFIAINQQTLERCSRRLRGLRLSWNERYISPPTKVRRN